MNPTQQLFAHLTGQHMASAVILRALASHLILREPSPRAAATALFDAISLFLDEGDDEKSSDPFETAMRASQRQEIDGFFHALVRDLGEDGTAAP